MSISFSHYMFRRHCPLHLCISTNNWLIIMRSQHILKLSLIWPHCPQTQIFYHKCVTLNFDSTLIRPYFPDTKSLGPTGILRPPGCHFPPFKALPPTSPDQSC